MMNNTRQCSFISKSPPKLSENSKLNFWYGNNIYTIAKYEIKPRTRFKKLTKPNSTHYLLNYFRFLKDSLRSIHDSCLSIKYQTRILVSSTKAVNKIVFQGISAHICLVLSSKYFVHAHFNLTDITYLHKTQRNDWLIICLSTHTAGGL